MARSVRRDDIQFPAQSSGFATQDGRLYEFVVTPVYVQAGGALGLLNVLVTGFPVGDGVACTASDGDRFVECFAGLYC